MKILELFKKTIEVDFTTLNELKEKRIHFVNEKYELEELTKKRARYKDGSIEKSRYLYSLNKNKNRITKLNNIIQSLNVKIEKEKVNQLKQYIWNNYNKNVGL